MANGRPEGYFVIVSKLDLSTVAERLDTGLIDRDAVVTAYGRYANFYDFLFGMIFEPGRRAAVAAVNTSPNQRILEVGVGTGLSLPKYRADARIIGIDLSPDMLVKARRRVARQGLEQVEALHEMNAEDMHFADDSFDAVVVMYTVSVVPDLAQLFSEIRRVCVAGGDIVVVNHFASRSFLPSLIEMAMTPLSASIGFRPDLSEDEFTHYANIEILETRRVNAFGYWNLIRGRNPGLPAAN
jgi:phosphatidylethanolamine/phosphatidyl-N-methylethanolamine N-methyltransferase